MIKWYQETIIVGQVDCFAKHACQNQTKKPQQKIVNSNQENSDISHPALLKGVFNQFIKSLHFLF